MADSIYHNSVQQFKSIKLDDINQLTLLKRVDDKYVMPVSELNKLLNKLKDSYDILEINGARELEYHTTYFDTKDNNLYLNHHNGRLNRFKVRMRTYKVSNHSFLELKQKTNKGRTIKSRKPIDKITDLTQEHYSFLESVIPINGTKLIKSVENTFSRITLVSFKSLERVTIDYNLQFLLNDKTTSLPFISIIEVKRDKKTGSSPIISALKEMNVYTRGFSKYCMGMTYIHTNLKQNSFKKNKLYLKKIENDTTSCY